MSLYFCIRDVLDDIEKSPQGPERFQKLVTINKTAEECNGFPEDIFVITNTPKVLDLTDANAPHKLAILLDEVPLYHINIELVLDKALSERHNNALLKEALGKAFKGEPLPNTLQLSQSASGDYSPGLRHPMLGHLNKSEICEIYIEFLNALGKPPPEYSFSSSILGKQAERFTQSYTGYITEHTGKLTAEIALLFGFRQDHDPGKAMENYIKTGEDKARKMGVTEEREMIWAWLEADHYQMRRCFDLDRLIKMGRMKRMPNWIKTDLFSLLEKEAMKQVFAGSLGRRGLPAELDKAPALKKAIEANAKGQVDETLQHLISQILDLETAYSGAAAKFGNAAKERKEQAGAAALA